MRELLNYIRNLKTTIAVPDSNLAERKKMKTYLFSTNQPDYIGHKEGIQFDIVDVCAILRIFYYDPTPMELFECQFSETFEMKAIELKDALYLLFKIGSLNWMDAPYNIHLSKNWDNKDSYKEMEEIDLVIQMVDCRTGTVKLLRSIELKGNIIKQIKKAIERQLQLPFEQKTYDENIAECYKKYSTNQMAKMAEYGFRLHKNN